MYNIRRANIGAVINFIGFNLLFFPQFIIGIQGMPRRYYDYPVQFQPAQIISTIGGLVLLVGLIIMISNLVKGARKGEKAPNSPWGGSTLEWTLPSPPSLENFDEEPVIKENPYDYK